MISTQIKAIVNTLSTRPSFLYGTMDELNLLLDKNNVWPVVCMYPLPPIPSNFTLSYAINNKFALMLDFLYKTEFGEFTTDNDNIVQSALTLTNEFMVKLANYREAPDKGRYFKVHQKDRATISTLYNKFDVNSTGVRLVITVGTMYNDGVAI